MMGTTIPIAERIKIIKERKILNRKSFFSESDLFRNFFKIEKTISATQIKKRATRTVIEYAFGAFSEKIQKGNTKINADARHNRIIKINFKKETNGERIFFSRTFLFSINYTKKKGAKCPLFPQIAKNYLKS